MGLVHTYEGLLAARWFLGVAEVSVHGPLERFNEQNIHDMNRLAFSQLRPTF